jgi:hypothetical protein
MREDEADLADRGQVQFLRDRHEVRAVGAEPVQDDQAGGGFFSGFELDDFQRRAHGGLPAPGLAP